MLLPVFLALFLFVATLLIAYVPFLVHVKSERVMNLISRFGQSLLVGCAFGIVLPEGVDALRRSTPNSEMHHLLGYGLIAGYTVLFFVDHIFSQFTKFLLPPTDELVLGSSRNSYTGDEANLGVNEYSMIDMRRNTSSQAGQRQKLNAPLSKWQKFVSLLKLRNKVESHMMVTLIGLFIHTLTDGFALAASSQDPGSVHTIILFAIILHKIPATIALSSTLLAKASKLRQSFIKLCLVLFSAGTPIGYLGTNTVLSMFKSRLEASTGGLALIFSAGTFTYIAQHTSNIDSDENKSAEFLSDSELAKSRLPFKLLMLFDLQFLASIVGLIFPTIMAMIVTH